MKIFLFILVIFMNTANASTRVGSIPTGEDRIIDLRTYNRTELDVSSLQKKYAEGYLERMKVGDYIKIKHSEDLIIKTKSRLVIFDKFESIIKYNDIFKSIEDLKENYRNNYFSDMTQEEINSELSTREISPFENLDF